MGLLALVRWQEKRVEVTRQCQVCVLVWTCLLIAPEPMRLVMAQDLIRSLDYSGWHTMHTAEQLSLSAESFAHTLRTPMYDVRTAVDVLSSGTYPSLPSFNTHNLLPPEALGATLDGEDERVAEQADFALRAQLLRCRLPPDISGVQIQRGRLRLTCADEFELTLSVQFEHPQRPWRPVKLRMLVRAQGAEYSNTDWLLNILERRMLEAREPLEDVRRFLGDCVRHLTWQARPPAAAPPPPAVPPCPARSTRRAACRSNLGPRRRRPRRRLPGASAGQAGGAAGW